jgi:hypothetical protein
VYLRVTQSGSYAIFVGRPLPLALSNEDGEPLSPVHEQGVDACDELVHLQVFADLDADARYELRIGPGAESLELVLELVVPETDWTCDDPTEPGNEPTEPGECTEGPDECPSCTALGEACKAASDCCSGRCYARQCVPLACRTEGYCERDDECCEYCHVTESPHCH